MARILTLTPNPAIDLSTSAERVVPIRKLRCSAARHDPGGGGINVARVIVRLGGEATALYPSGGAVGCLLQRLVAREGVASITVPVADETRLDFTALDRTSRQQYRFVLPGPALEEVDWRRCLDALRMVSPPPEFVVGGGSLPPGVPEDFFAQAARIARAAGARMVLDTSGPALRAGLEAGVYLAKPNLGELRGLTGASLLREADWINAARKLVKTGQAEAVALTLGDQGALLVTRTAAFRALPPAVELVSAVGAGDCFLGAMLWSLAAGHGLVEALRYGVAAGSAAVINPGTELCHAADVHRLYDEVTVQPV
ncbi:MAG TPA: 1-phosphofructokinase family hexose kinase [Xanthobacteraceae bacterium]|nr:1-phosphofructokinase family hexose kinase [Xanthobacteraceae bacterium]